MNQELIQMFFDTQKQCNFEIDMFGKVTTPGLAELLDIITDSLNPEEIDFICEETQGAF